MCLGGFAKNSVILESIVCIVSDDHCICLSLWDNLFFFFFTAKEK